jgi:hypothetical protein
VGKPEGKNRTVLKNVFSRISPRAQGIFHAIQVCDMNVRYINRKRHGSAVGTATGHGVRVPIGSRNFAFPYRPDRFWDPPNLLSSGYRGFFPGSKVARA